MSAIHTSDFVAHVVENTAGDFVASFSTRFLANFFVDEGGGCYRHRATWFVPVLTARKLDDECGCPEEMWDTPWGELHMHLSAGKSSNACLDNGDEGERHIDVTTTTVDEARAAIFAWAGYPAVVPKVASDGGTGLDALAKHVADVMAEDGGCWTACSGCQESDEGCVSEKYYPYSPIFRCQPGGGCSECGGIGVIWNDAAFLASWGDVLAADATDGVTGDA